MRVQPHKDVDQDSDNDSVDSDAEKTLEERYLAEVDKISAEGQQYGAKLKIIEYRDTFKADFYGLIMAAYVASANRLTIDDSSTLASVLEQTSAVPVVGDILSKSANVVRAINRLNIK